MIIRYVKFEGNLGFILFHSLENLLRDGDLVWIFGLRLPTCSHNVVIGYSRERPLSVVHFLIEQVYARVFLVVISEVLVDLLNIKHLSRLIGKY